MNTLTTLRDHTTHNRIILWGWQLAQWHSQAQIDEAITIQAYKAAWVDVIDCADIYTGVEEAIWRVRNSVWSLDFPRIHTKHVPDLNAIETNTVTPESTRLLIERSLCRLGAMKLDLVQFHHWDYTIDTYRTSIWTLLELQDEWKIWAVWVTNCSVEFLSKLESELEFIPITTQNQYNIIDRRIEKSLIDFAMERDIGVYAYGSLMGWLISDKYLGMPEPQEPIENRSLRKYLQIIRDWGTWDMFQGMLELLSIMAWRYSVTISDIAIHWTLSRRWINAVILWARHPQHASSLHRIFSFSLSENDMREIDSIYQQWSPIVWDVFDIERYETRHRDIMKFNLNDPKK